MVAIETKPHPFVEEFRAVVALPVIGRGGDLDGCLNALFSQVDRYGRPLEPGSVTVLLLHDGDRETGRVARAWQECQPEHLHIAEHPLPDAPGTRGHARRMAVEAAAMLREDARAILLTEPGVVPALDWVAAGVAALRLGADLVAGHFAASAAADGPEAAYRMLLAEIEARIDPQRHDPWPRHTSFSFASLALRPDLAFSRTLAAVLEAEPCGAVRLLKQAGLKLRHEPAAMVDGEAPVMEATAIEPAFRAFSRARWRGEMRLQHARCSGNARQWEERLRLQPGTVLQLWAQPVFDAIWERIEQMSPMLTRRPLHSADLPEEMRQAANMLAALRSADPAASRAPMQPARHPPAPRRIAAARRAVPAAA